MSQGPMKEPFVQRIVLEQPKTFGRNLAMLLLVVLLGLSFLGNAFLVVVVTAQAIFNDRAATAQDVPADTANLLESFHSGKEDAKNKIALVRVEGVIMDETAAQVLAQIKKAQADEDVRGVVLQIDSPGGLVSDSEHLHHRLKELREGREGKPGKPLVVAMRSLAASGGYYIAMAAGPKGKLFAEPSTITGSIGVIMPRYDVSKLLEQWKIGAESITSGPMKDAGSPFRPLSEEERQFWHGIINQAYQRFQEVVSEGRPNLPREKLAKLADGRIYTAQDALEHGLIDSIGYVEDAIEEAKKIAGLSEARVVTYTEKPSVLEELFSVSSSARPTASFDVQSLLESTSPRAYYLMGPAIPQTFRRGN